MAVAVVWIPAYTKIKANSGKQSIRFLTFDFRFESPSADNCEPSAAEIAAKQRQLLSPQRQAMGIVG
jgi:hypothetical protein